jgi:hypothetical protein
MLFDAGFQVVPPAAAVAELRRVSHRLKLKLFPGLGGAYWAVMEQWRLNDARRERIKQNEIPPDADFDIATTFPPSMRAEDVVAWVSRTYGERVLDDVAAEAEAERQTIALMEAQVAAKKAKLDAFLVDSEQKVKDDSSHLRLVSAGVEKAHPMVAGFGTPPKRTTD